MRRPDMIRLEHDVYRAAIDDGVWDVVLGLSLLLIGGSIAAGHPVVGPLVATPIIAMAAVVRRAIAQRSGHVRLHRFRLDRIRRGTTILPMVVLALIAVLLFAGRRVHDLVKSGLLLSTSIAVAAYLFELSRLYVYATLIAIAIAGVLLSGARWEWALIGPGVLILVLGLIVFGRFLRPHPPTGEPWNV